MALGLLWILDGALQLQPYMFVRGSDGFLGPVAQNTMGPPNVLTDFLRAATTVLVAHQDLATVAIAAVQIGLGAGLLWRRSVRAALGASAIWAVGVWIVGEGVGQLVFPQASMLTGAPGAAAVYAVLAVVLWPPAPAEGSPGRAGRGGRGLLRGPGDRIGWGRAAWAVLWCATALLELEHANWAPNAISAQLHHAAAGQPGWLAYLDHAAAAAVSGAGTQAAFGLLVVEFAIGWGVLRPATRRFALGSGAVVSLVLWLSGQSLGGVLTGRGTDPSLGPAMVLLAVALWPSPTPSHAGDAAGEALVSRSRGVAAVVTSAAERVRLDIVAAGTGVTGRRDWPSTRLTQGESSKSEAHRRRPSSRATEKTM